MTEITAHWLYSLKEGCAILEEAETAIIFFSLILYTLQYEKKKPHLKI